MTRWSATLLVGLLFCFGGVARACAQGELPREAQEAFARGIAAVEQEQFDVAVRSFAAAQRMAPRTPVVLFNLGLAHAKSGHELAAMIWLNAYLTAAREAANASAVAKEVRRLDVVAEGKVGKIWKEAIADVRLETKSSMREARLDWLATSMAEAGDLARALELRPQCRPCRFVHVTFLVSVRDVAGAIRFAEQLDDSERYLGKTDRERAWNTIRLTALSSSSRYSAESRRACEASISFQPVTCLARVEAEHATWAGKGDALRSWLRIGEWYATSDPVSEFRGVGQIEDDLEAALRAAASGSMDQGGLAGIAKKLNAVLFVIRAVADGRVFRDW